MAEDLGAKFIRINAAKKAAADLRQLVSKCKTPFLREEGELLANEAVETIKQIEAKAMDPNCNLLDETIGKAALRAEDALRVLAGKVAAADRQTKPGNILSKIGRQFSNPHKQMFKDTRDTLKLVLPSMTEEPDAGLTDSEDEDDAEAQQQQQQQQLQPAQNSGSSELHLTYQKGNIRVCAVALTPGPDGNVAHSTLWVGLNKKMEFYVGCNPRNKSEVLLQEKGQAVTSAVFDSSGGVWTGHADGVVRLHLRGMWGAAQHPTNVGLPVRSMAIDSRGHCWVGDEAGIIRVLILDPNTGRLSCKVQLAPPQAQGLLRLAGLQGAAAAAAAFNASSSSSGGNTLVRLGSGGSSSQTLAKATPVSAMFSKGLAVFSSGGEWPYNITVWNSHSYQKLEVSNCESFGATCSFALLPWEAPLEAAAGGPVGHEDSSRAVPGVPATGIAVGYATAQPRATVPARIMAASLAKQAATASSSSSTAKPADASDYSSWRLLSGHERGQVLLWQVNGVTRTPGTPKLLQLLAVIGEARPQCGVRGMAVFEELSMLALVHANGDLTALPMPKASNGAVAASSSGPAFSAVGVPASRPAAASGSGVMFGAASLHTWNPRMAHIKAHKHPVVATSSLGELLITATSNTVKCWTAERLKLEAQGDGLMFRRSKSYNSASTAAALAAAIAAADSSAEFAITAPGRLEALDRDAAAAAAVAAAAATASWPIDDDDVVGDVLPGLRRHGVSADDDNRSAHGAGTHRLSAPARAESAPGAVIGAALQDCKAPNPMSRENASRRGLQLDPTGTVVMKRAEPPSTFPNMYPMSGVHVPSYPPILPVAAEYPPGQYVPPVLTAGGEPRHLHHSQSTPPGAGSLALSTSSNGLEPSPSINAEIREHHVIVNSELVLKEVIGSGAEGKVYRGTWTNIDIAAKEYLAVDDGEGTATQTLEAPSEIAMQRARNALRKEVSLLTSLNHPNLVRFCGVCLDPPLVVMEYYKHGNIFTLIEKARKQWVSNQAKPAQSLKSAKYMNYFTWDRRLEMLHDVAAGMMYLHKRLYVHGDLRSPNLFVGQDGRVKIGDFGFTKRLSGKQSSMQVKRITHPRWVAPELMTDCRLSAASDVYSFGIIMYEMLTWLLPFHDQSKEQVVFFVLTGGRPEIPADDQLPPFTSSSTCLGNYKKLLQECWDQDPARRPHFDKIAARLKAMIRWRLVIRQNKVLSDVARKLKAARQDNAKAAIPTPPPAAATAAAAKPEIVNAADLESHMAAVANPAKDAVKLLAAAPAAAPAPAPAEDVPAVVPAVRMAETSTALNTVDEEDHEPLPVPDHPIVDISDHLVIAAGDAQAADVPIHPVIRASSAPATAVVQGIQKAAGEAAHELAPVHGAAAQQQQHQQQHDTDSPFAAPAPSHPQMLPPRAMVRRVPSGRSRDVVVFGPGGQQLIVGSDLPESPCSQCTLSTRASYDVTGLSTTTDGAATPTTSVLAAGQDMGARSSGMYDMQGSKSADVGRVLYQVPGHPPLSTSPPAAAVVSLSLEQPDSPPPPGYPVCGRDGSFQAAQVQYVTVRGGVDVDAAAAEESGSWQAAADTAGGIRSTSSLLPPASASARLDTIQESSEGASGTVSSRAISSMALENAGSQAAGSLGHTPTDSVDAAAGPPSSSAAPQVASAPAGPVSTAGQHEQLAGSWAGTATGVGAQQQVSGVQQGTSPALSADGLLRYGPDGVQAPECKVTPWLLQQHSQSALASEASQQAHTSAAAARHDSSTEDYQHQQDGPAFSTAIVGTGLPNGFLSNDSVASPFLQGTAVTQLAMQGSGQQSQQHLGQQSPGKAAAPAAAAAAAANDEDALPVVDSDDMGAFGQRASQQQHQQHQDPDHFTAADSPFFQTFGTTADSSSVNMDEVFGGAAAARGVSASGPSFAGFQAYQSAYDYLDDSKLPLDDDEPKLGEAVTVVYPEGQAVVDAAIKSSCTVKVGGSFSSSSYTMPSLEEGVVGVNAASGEPAGPPAGEVRGSSFTAVERSPFATQDLCDDPCESLGLGGLLQPTGAPAAPASTGVSPFAAPGEPATAAAKEADEPTATAASPGPGVSQAAHGVYPCGMYSPGMFAGHYLPGMGVSVCPAVAPLQAPGFTGQSAGPQTVSPGQQLQQLQLAQQQHPAAYQTDPMGPGWLPSMMPQLLALNPALGPFHLPQLRPVYPGATLAFGGQLPGQTAAAAADGGAPSRALSGVPDSAMASGMTQGSLASPGSPGPKSTAATAADDAPVKYNKPLGDDVLNKRLGDSEEDVTERARRDLEVWTRQNVKPRRASGSTGDVTRQDAACDLSRVSTASDATARTVSPAVAPPVASSPMIPAPANSPLLTQLMANPALAAAAAGGFGYAGLDPTVLSALLMGGSPVTAAASGGMPPKVSPTGFSQVQPGEKVKVVNKPNAHSGTSDSFYLVQQHQQQYLQQQSPAALQGWLGGAHTSGAYMAQPAQQLPTMSPAAATQQQQQQQQFEMMAALLLQQQQQLQQQMARGLGAQSHPVADPAAGNSALVAEAALLNRWSHAVAGSGEASAIPQEPVDTITTQQRQQIAQQQHLTQQQQQQAQVQHMYQYYMQQQQQQQPAPQQPQQAAAVPIVPQGTAPAQQQAARLQRMPAQRR